MLLLLTDANPNVSVIFYDGIFKVCVVGANFYVMGLGYGFGDFRWVGIVVDGSRRLSFWGCF